MSSGCTAVNCGERQAWESYQSLREIHNQGPPSGGVTMRSQGANSPAQPTILLPRVGSTTLANPQPSRYPSPQGGECGRFRDYNQLGESLRDSPLPLVTVSAEVRRSSSLPRHAGSYKCGVKCPCDATGRFYRASTRENSTLDPREQCEINLLLVEPCTHVREQLGDIVKLRGVPKAFLYQPRAERRKKAGR